MIIDLGKAQEEEEDSLPPNTNSCDAEEWNDPAARETTSMWSTKYVWGLNETATLESRLFKNAFNKRFLSWSGFTD